MAISFGSLASGFDGDIVSLNNILHTLDAKLIAIPGITCGEVSGVDVPGVNAYYYKRSDSGVTLGNLGQKHTYSAVGVTLQTIPLTSAAIIADVVPMDQIKLVKGVDVIQDRITYDTIAAANKINEAFLTFLYTSTGVITGTAALTKDTVYGVIVDAIKQYKILNAAAGLNPTTIIVGPTVESLLLQSPTFIRPTDLGDAAISEAILTFINGLKVVTAVDMDETVGKYDFAILDSEAVYAPTNVRFLNTVDATPNYGHGVDISGEIGYGFKITDNNRLLWRKHA